jgi:hypothetical protein
MAENKPVPVSSSALIPVGGRNFASMTDASQLDSLKASAPAFHNAIDRALKVQGKVRDMDSIQEIKSKQYYTPKRVEPKGFVTGAPVIDNEGRKLTIIHASAGHTKKTHTPVHRVVNKRGESWLAKETDLSLRVK